MKTNYSKQFELWWKAYPRKTAKAVAARSWEKHVDENDAFMVKAMIADLEKRTRVRWWPADKNKIPHAATWINQGRYLDEGWEDDVKTRGKESLATYTPMPQPKVDDRPLMSGWKMMCNRLMRNYLLKMNGMPNNMLELLVKEKAATLREIEPAIEEELAVDNTREKKEQMAFLLASTLLQRFDRLTGVSIAGRVIDMSRKGQ